MFVDHLLFIFVESSNRLTIMYQLKMEEKPVGPSAICSVVHSFKLQFFNKYF